MNKSGILALLLMLSCTALVAPNDDLSHLNDEFQDPASLSRWTRHDVAEGWPSQWKRLDVSSTSKDHLYLEPYTSGWWAGYRAPFLFKLVTGDFIVTTKLKASGRNSDVPERAWSLMGLMARAPRAVGATPNTWNERQENWVFLTVGTANLPGIAQIEDKTTRNGESTLRLQTTSPGWVELRMARIGRSVILLRKTPQGWQVHQRFDRPDLPSTLQVGLNAYTDWPTLQARVDNGALNARTYNANVFRDGQPDLIGRVDWVRFQRPVVPNTLKGKNLTDSAVSNAQLLTFLGDVR